MRFTIINRPLFIRKLVLLLLTVGILAPLVIWKLSLPAYVYVASLLVLHIWISVVYLYQVNWRQFSKLGLTTRIVSVVFFAYLLKLLDYSDARTILLNVALALVLHIVILLVLMVRLHRQEP